MFRTIADCAAGRVTVNILPDDILLLIFHFYRVIEKLAGVDRAQRLSWGWDRLAHVCQRWRSIVFASPRFLDLALICGPRTPLELVDIWPALPIIMRNTHDNPFPKDYNFDAAIVHRSRICQIDLNPSRWNWQRLTSIMQEQFPALIHLSLNSNNYCDFADVALPDGFLGGSAPCLRSLKFIFIAFPALPKFLLSATALVRLELWDIPQSGYFSPEAIVTGLAVLVNLKSLIIGFKSGSRHDQESRRLPPPSRTVLPALTDFNFQGVSGYLDEFVVRIDVPLLDTFSITFTKQLIFDVSQLAEFMGRTTRFQALNEAHVDFDYDGVSVISLPPAWNLDEKPRFSITCRAVIRQPSNVVQILTSLFPSIYTVEHLYMYGSELFFELWQDPMQWLGNFRPFNAVKNLYVAKEMAQHIALALQELVGERATVVLPVLEGLYLEELQPPGHVQEAVEQFVTARQLLGRPVVVSHWKTNYVDSELPLLLRLVPPSHY